VLLAALASAAAAGEPGEELGPARRAAVAASVRRFALEVAAQVSARGPTAWRQYFSATPEFFMAVNGQLQFADSDAATRAIAALPGVIRRLQLSWGKDLRVDPLTAQFAVVASSYTEIQASPQGQERPLVVAAGGKLATGTAAAGRRGAGCCHRGRRRCRMAAPSAVGFGLPKETPCVPLCKCRSQSCS
jgi:hypothetical protein